MSHRIVALKNNPFYKLCLLIIISLFFIAFNFDVLSFSMEDKPCPESPENKNKCIELIDQGRNFLAQQAWVEAEDSFTKLLDIIPDNKPSLLYRSFARSAQGKTKDAISDLERLEKLAPDFIILNGLKANIYFDIGDYDKAITAYSKAIELEGESVDYYKHRGVSFYNLGHYTNALKDFESALSSLEKRKTRIFESPSNVYSPEETEIQKLIDNCKNFLDHQ